MWYRLERGPGLQCLGWGRRRSGGLLSCLRGGFQEQQGGEGGKRRAGPCSLVLIAGHLCGCMRLACVGHLYVWCVGHPYVWYYNITGHSMSMCMLAHEYMDGALHCLHACA